jgi:hypothetical protein
VDKVKNLDEWYNRWQSFFLELSFGDSDGRGGIVFSEEQKWCIIRMDETKLSMDGSDGAIGGRPANSITLLGVSRAGTTIKKSSMESFYCHIMFYSFAQEDNYQVDARWFANFPHVVARFENKAEQE